MFDKFPDMLNVQQLQIALGIGRSKAYELLNSGAIKHFRIGKSLKIPKRFLLDFVLDGCYNDTCNGLVN